MTINKKRIERTWKGDDLRSRVKKRGGLPCVGVLYRAGHNHPEWAQEVGTQGVCFETNRGEGGIVIGEGQQPKGKRSTGRGGGMLIDSTGGGNETAT